MERAIVSMPEIKLVGITCRTNNISERNFEMAKIGPIVQKYFEEQLFNKIMNRKMPGTTFSIYTQYESDHTGDYTYFLGEEVSSFESISPGFETLTISPQNYIKWTIGPDKMPDVCIKAWEKIWAMSPSELGGKRAYIADFEIYDERSHDFSNAILDIYVGVHDD